VALGADEEDGPGGIDLPNALDGRGPGPAAADDDILKGLFRHGVPLSRIPASIVADIEALSSAPGRGAGGPLRAERFCYNGSDNSGGDHMFCPVCWKEYPKGMRHCDSCRAELIEENPKDTAEKKDKPAAPADEQKPPKK
jgi:hypothetical protein